MMNDELRMEGDENHITSGLDTNKEVSSKGVKFFLIYFGLYLAVWGMVHIASRVCNPNYFQNSLEVSYVVMGFLLSIAEAAVLGIIPAIILGKAKKREYVYFPVLGFLLINIAAYFSIGTDLKFLGWIPVLYDTHFLVFLDALTLTNLTDSSGFLFLVIFPTAYYLLLIWISLLLSHRSKALNLKP